MRVSILPVNTPTINGRIYPKEVIQKALDELDVKEIPFIVGAPGLNGEISLGDIAGKVTNLTLTESSLDADIEILDNPKGKIAKEILTNPLSYMITAYGMGIIDEYCVTDYVIQGCQLTTEVHPCK